MTNVSSFSKTRTSWMARPFSIRSTLYLLILACLIPIWVAVGGLLYYAYQAKHSLTQNLILHTAHALNMSVESEFARVQAGLEILALLPVGTTAELAAFHAKARQVLRTFPGADIILADGSGQQLVNTYRDFGEKLPIRNAPAVIKKIFETGKPVISNLFRGAVTKRFLISVDIPVFLGDRVAYDLAMTFPAEHIASILQRQRLPMHWLGFILDSDDVIAARTIAPEQFVGRQARPELRQKIAEGGEGTISNNNLQGVSQVLAFSRSVATGWVVGVGVPQSQFYADLETWLFFTISSVITLSLIAIGLAFAVAQRISRSIQALVVPAMALGHGTQVSSATHPVTECTEVAKALMQASDLIIENKSELSAMIHEQQAILNSDIVGFVILQSRRMIWMNHAYARMLGYEKDELLGVPTRVLYFDDESYAAFGITAYALIAVGMSSHSEMQYRRKDGSVGWYDVSGAELRSEEDKTIWAFIDITARKQAEINLSFERSHLHALLASIPDWVWLKNKNGIYMNCNHGLQKFFGADECDIIGKTDYDFVDLQTSDMFRGNDIAAMEAAGLHINEEEIIFADDGRRACMETSRTCMRSSDGKIIGVLGISRDITERKRLEGRLRQSEARLSSLIESTSDWVWETDTNYCFVWLSSSFDHIFGSSMQVLGKSRWDLAAKDHDIEARHWQGHRADIAACRSFRDFRYWLRIADGQIRWISVSGSPYYDDTGTFLGYRGVGSDITEQAATALRLKMLSTVVEQSPVSVVITDQNGTIEYVNPHFTVTTGYQSAEAIGNNPSLCSSDKTPKEVYIDILNTIYTGNSWAGELLKRRKDGEVRWEEVLITPVRNGEGQIAHFMSISKDVTDRHNLEDTLREMARTDPLTGLANRRAFIEVMEAEVLRSRRFGSAAAVLMIDIDHFKQVNDTYGHEVGDRALVSLTAVLKATTRSTDLPARFGGEEFVCLLPETELSGAVEMAERIRSAVARIAVTAPAGDFGITVSIGVASFNKYCREDWNDVVLRADMRMYKAKSRGRNKVISSDDS